MSVDEKHFFLMQLYTNDFYREIFSLSPNLLLDLNNTLSEQEKYVLSRLDLSAVTKVAKSLKYKLWSNIKEILDPICNYFDKELFNLFDRFYLVNKRTTYDNITNYTIKFGNFVLESLANNESDRVICNLLKFKLQELQAKKNNLPNFLVESIRLKPDSKLHLYPNIFLESYDYNIVELINQYNPNKPPTKLPSSYIMYSVDNYLTKSYVSEDTVVFLNFCNGDWSLKKILQFYKLKDIKRQEMLEEIQNMIDNRILYSR